MPITYDRDGYLDLVTPLSELDSDWAPVQDKLQAYVDLLNSPREDDTYWQDVHAADDSVKDAFEDRYVNGNGVRHLLESLDNRLYDVPDETVRDRIIGLVGRARRFGTDELWSKLSSVYFDADNRPHDINATREAISGALDALNDYRDFLRSHKDLKLKLTEGAPWLVDSTEVDPEAYYGRMYTKPSAAVIDALT